MDLVEVAGVLLFLLSAALFTAHFAAPSRKLAMVARLVMALAVVIEGVAFGHRFVANGFSLETGFGDALAYFGWVVAVVFLVVDARYRLPSMGGFVGPVLAMSFLSALLMRSESQTIPESVRIAGLPLHIVVAFLGLAAFTLSTGAAGAYLIFERQFKAKRFGAFVSRFPSLESLDRLSAVLMKWGFIFLSITLITGAFFAKQAWGTYWSWEPKLIATLAAWLIFAVLFHARAFAGWRGRRAGWLTIAGFTVLIGSFVLFNLFPVGLHGGGFR